jgi:hypothetical protein
MKFRLIIFSLISTAFMWACSGSVDSDSNNEPPAEPELVYFWFFDTSLPNDTELETIFASFSGSNHVASIEFQSSLSGYPDTDRNASLERRNQPTELNYRPEGNGNLSYAEAAENNRGIQIKQPFTGDAGENILIFHLPTEGFEAPVFSIASIDEDAADALRFEYSVSSDVHQWITDGLENNEIVQELSDEEYRLFEIDFSGISETDNNADFKIRIRFDVEDGTANDGSRVTFNNAALDAVPLEQ